MKNALSSARHEGESFANYVARRKFVAAKIKERMRGRLVHASAELVAVKLPLVPDSEDAKAIERGMFRDLTPPTPDKDGKLHLFGRLKGATFVKTRLVAGRNDPCRCQSGIKFKRCCGR